MKKYKWCVYGILSDSVGKVVDYRKKSKSVDILYSEGQTYRPEIWDINYVKFFDKIQNAYNYVIKHRNVHDQMHIYDKVTSDFKEAKNLKPNYHD